MQEEAAAAAAALDLLELCPDVEVLVVPADLLAGGIPGHLRKAAALITPKSSGRRAQRCRRKKAGRCGHDRRWHAPRTSTASISPCSNYPASRRHAANISRSDLQRAGGSGGVGGGGSHRARVAAPGVAGPVLPARWWRQPRTQPIPASRQSANTAPLRAFNHRRHCATQQLAAAAVRRVLTVGQLSAFPQMSGFERVKATSCQAGSSSEPVDRGQCPVTQARRLPGLCLCCQDRP